MTKEEKKRLARFYAGCEKRLMTSCKKGYTEKCQIYKNSMQNPIPTL